MPSAAAFLRGTETKWGRCFRHPAAYRGRLLRSRHLCRLAHQADGKGFRESISRRFEAFAGVRGLPQSRPLAADPTSAQRVFLGGFQKNGGSLRQLAEPPPGCERPRLIDPAPEILVLEFLTAVPSSSKKNPAPRRTNGRNARTAPKPLPVQGLFLPRRPRTEIGRKDQSREHVRSSRDDRRFRPFVRICPTRGPAKISRPKPP